MNYIEREILFKEIILMLVGSYILILSSEIVHDRFLNSSFDILDMIASLVGFVIMASVYKSC